MKNKTNVKTSQLLATFERNYKITRMYAEYLERYPEVITTEMIDTLTEDGEITREEALVALLCEIFGLDFNNGLEDRILIKDYLTPSVRLLDRKKYESDPYYKNVRLENIKDGNWEIRWEKYSPYQAVIAGDMIIKEDFSEIPPLGFFTEEFRFPAVLEDGNEWMTLTPVDLDTSKEAIDAAHGKVVTFGLGLGYYAYMVSEKSDVDSITVIEKSPDVIRLFKNHILPKFPNKQKVRIIEADAFEYAERTMPGEKYDVAFVDTWRDASDGAPMYERMKRLEHLSPDTKFLYWIENFLISRHRALRLEEIYSEIDGGADLSFEKIIKILENPL
ncbi:MAG: hypothetical protein IJX92_01350 [Clostridia bacterium]|nr:hypothetical protein [Clostridia bacterium]